MKLAKDIGVLVYAQLGLGNVRKYDKNLLYIALAMYADHNALFVCTPQHPVWGECVQDDGHSITTMVGDNMGIHEYLPSVVFLTIPEVHATLRDMLMWVVEQWEVSMDDVYVMFDIHPSASQDAVSALQAERDALHNFPLANFILNQHS